MTTPNDVIKFALWNGGIVSISETIYADDTYNALDALNSILSEWQVNRWLSYDLASYPLTSTGATSYTVGPAGDVDTTPADRPDRIDAVVATTGGTDIPLWPFMSREGYDRVAIKAASGIPESYFYESSLPLGTIYLTPVPDDSYTLQLFAKAYLQKFANLTTTITLSDPHIAALRWNLAAELRSLYRLPPDPNVSMRAERTLQTLVNSIAQVPIAVQPMGTTRQGNYSVMPPPAPAPTGGQ
jgi:hypothetical protein